MRTKRTRYHIHLQLDNGVIGDLITQTEMTIGKEATIKITVNGKTIETTGLITEILAIDCFTV